MDYARCCDLLWFVQYVSVTESARSTIIQIKWYHRRLEAVLSLSSTRGGRSQLHHYLYSPSNVRKSLGEREGLELHAIAGAYLIRGC